MHRLRTLTMLSVEELLECDPGVAAFELHRRREVSWRAAARADVSESFDVDMRLDLEEERLRVVFVLD